MMKWMFIIVLVISTLGLNGCADTADAEDSNPPIVEQQTASDGSSNSASGATVWIAIVLTWNPVNRTIDKEFASEINCWNYYDTGAGESKMLNSYGIQVLDHQGNKPDKEYMKKHRPSHREYPTRMYKNNGGWMVWLTCDIKGRYEDL